MGNLGGFTIRPLGKRFFSHSHQDERLGSSPEGRRHGVVGLPHLKDSKSVEQVRSRLFEDAFEDRPKAILCFRSVRSIR